MRPVAPLLLFVALLLSSSCQQPAVEAEEATPSEPKPLRYSTSLIEKSLRCREKPEENCLSIRIEKLKVTGGATEKTMTAISEHLSKQLTATDNAERQARSPEEVAQFIQEEYSRISEEMPNYKLPWEYTRDFEVYLNKNGIFGVALHAHSFTGGAHPADFTYYYQYDTDKGKRIRLANLFIPKFFAEFKALAEKHFRLSRSLEPDQNYEDAGYFMEEFELSDNYRYTPDGIRFLYNPYEIAPYSEGPISLFFDYELVEKFIVDGYRF